MSIILTALAWLLTYLVHSTLFLLGAAGLSAAGLVRSHAARDTLWKVALLGGLLTATAQSALRLQPWAGHVALAARSDSPFVEVAGVRTVHVRPAAPESTPAGAAFASAIAQRELAVLPPEPAAQAAPSRTIRRLLSGIHISWPAMLLNLWFVGALGLGAQLWLMRRGLSRRLRERRVVQGGPLATALRDLCVQAGVPMPRLSTSGQLIGPIAFGHEICVPERVLTSLAPAEQRAVLAHELGHVVRRDPAWVAAAACIESVCFVQPLNRLARRRLREASEYLCDDFAAERTSGVVLAGCLARVAEWMQGEPSAAVPAVVAGIAGRCSELVSRVERLLAGAAPARPARFGLRALAGASALVLVAWSVPGVAAEDIGDGASGATREARAEFATLPPGIALVSVGSWQDGSWGQIRDDGRLIVFAPGYSARLTGRGRLGFRQYGRAIAVPEGYVVTVGGSEVTDDRELCDGSGLVRIVGPDGAWDVVPERQPGALGYANARSRVVDADGDVSEAIARAAEETRAALRDAQTDVDTATDTALNGEVDAAIDTLVQLWVRDPEAVRRAARRIARTYDRDLRPEFESLGVQLGRELSPQLQRLSDRVGRDLAPEFARLGAELGASIVQSLADPDAVSLRGGKGKSLPRKH